MYLIYLACVCEEGVKKRDVVNYMFLIELENVFTYVQYFAGCIDVFGEVKLHYSRLFIVFVYALRIFMLKIRVIKL